MRTLLQTLTARGPAPAAGQLLQLWTLTPVRLPVAPSLALPVALTASELAVLRRLAGGHPYAQMAGELTVSLNTVRSHAKHLFAKLDVHSRTQAIARARELGLGLPCGLQHDPWR